MQAPRRPRTRVRITDTLALGLDQFLESRGQQLDRPQEIRDSVLRGLVLRREPSGLKTWHYGYSFSGRRGRVKIGNCPALSVKSARKSATGVAARVAAGDDPAAERREQRDRARESRCLEKRLGAFIEGPYRAWAEAHLSSHKETIAALTADFGNSVKEDRKRGAGWWNRDMDQISQEDADQWRTRQLRLGNKATTINRAWQRLRAVLGKAVDWKYIAGPPLRVSKLKTDKRGRVRYLSMEERARLFAALENREEERKRKHERFNQWRMMRHRRPLPSYGAFTDYLQPLTRTLLGSGLRRKEALSLRRKDLDFELELINVPGEIAKNRQSRSVPMQPDNKECLIIWLAQSPNDSPDDLVFPSRRGVRIKRICAAWKKLMRMAQITNFRVHDTRHDYASRLAMAEVSLKTIAELLGHEDLTQVQRYAHLSKKHLRDSALRLKPDPTPWRTDSTTEDHTLPINESESPTPEAAPVRSPESENHYAGS